MQIKVYILYRWTTTTGWSISTYKLSRRNEILVWVLKRHCYYSTLNQIINDYENSPIPVLRWEEGMPEHPFEAKLVSPEELAEAKPLKEFLRSRGLYEY